MRKTEEDHLSKRVWMIRRKEIWIKEIKDSRHLSSGVDLKHINKGSHLKLKKNDIFLGKEAKTTTHKILEM
jgi:hypothetical protein